MSRALSIRLYQNTPPSVKLLFSDRLRHPESSYEQANHCTRRIATRHCNRTERTAGNPFLALSRSSAVILKCAVLRRILFAFHVKHRIFDTNSCKLFDCVRLLSLTVCRNALFERSFSPQASVQRLSTNCHRSRNCMCLAAL